MPAAVLRRKAEAAATPAAARIWFVSLGVQKLFRGWVGMHGKAQQQQG